jgi:hypothetical protein
MTPIELDKTLDDMHKEAMKTGDFVSRQLFGRTVSAIRRTTGHNLYSVNFHIDRINVKRAQMLEILTNPIGLVGALFAAKIAASHARHSAWVP